MGFPALVALIIQAERTVENGFDCGSWPQTPALSSFSNGIQSAGVTQCSVSPPTAAGQCVSREA